MLTSKYKISPFANLYGADLRGADLRGANLHGANLCGHKFIQGPLRSDGYVFYFQNFDNNPRIIAGCRNFSPDEAIQHWTATRGGTPLGDETLLIVDQLLSLAKLRRLL